MQINLKLDTVALETILTHDDTADLLIFTPGWALHGEDPDRCQQPRFFAIEEGQKGLP
jgi:hypothetical protein